MSEAVEGGASCAAAGVSGLHGLRARGARQVHTMRERRCSGPLARSPVRVRKNGGDELCARSDGDEDEKK